MVSLLMCQTGLMRAPLGKFLQPAVPHCCCKAHNGTQWLGWDRMGRNLEWSWSPAVAMWIPVCFLTSHQVNKWLCKTVAKIYVSNSVESLSIGKKKNKSGFMSEMLEKDCKCFMPKNSFQNCNSGKDWKAGPCLLPKWEMKLENAIHDWYYE